ncbi:hypothetical protein CY34DRAFT_757493 [Suillus luteus UH-Slu-Lm8-n1]|uniref:C2H2-type domain-containing protein n=1 Tax=Suillus luteus UH-Slu-Lm8-n1 TaxID=930992 RepID=A0A0D0B874_9AGAM|nr:hypothetical protein CY34DRAFT_757493 [Suillus luteus UH-Slu-Lm8-n1]
MRYYLPPPEDSSSVNMNNNGAHSSLPIPNSSASSSTNNTPVVSNATVPASSSTSTVQGPAPQHGNLTFGTPAEQEGASRPRRDLALQRERLRAMRALQQDAAQRAQFQLQAAQAQPPLPQHHGPQNIYNFPYYPQPQPQAPPHQQAHLANVPALPNPNLPGLPPNALDGIADENAGFGARYGPHGMPAPMRNAGGPPPIPQGPPYQWPVYGHPAPQYQAGYPGAHAHGVAPFAAPHHGHPMHVPPPPAHWPPAALFAGPPYPPPQFQQVQFPQVPPLGPVEGDSTRSSKRKAVDVDDAIQPKPKRHRPQGDPNFAPAPPDPDGKARWKCLKMACARVKPMLEYSVHKHVTQTKSHQAGSSESRSDNVCPECGTSFLRPDSLRRHRFTDKCDRNKSKTPQASFAVLGNGPFAAGPSSSGSVAQSIPLPMATPNIVQATGNSTSVPAAPVVMPQRQFSFQARVPAPSSVAPQSGAQAMSQPVPSLYELLQQVSSEVQSDTQASREATSVQRQPAVALSSHDIQGDFSTPDNISIPLPSTQERRSVQPPSGNSAPIIAGDFSFTIFGQAAASTPILPPSSHSPSEEVVDDSSADLFSSPPSPTPSEDVLDSLHLFSAPPSPTSSKEFSLLFSAPPSPG